MHRTSRIPSSVLALVLGVGLAVPAGAAMPDAWITMKTKLALLTTADVSGMAINVDTVFGRVTLHGTVRSAKEQAKAETVARQINGVQGVSNLLQVVARAEQTAVQARDDELAQAVQTAFATPAFKDITVEVQNGVVRLTGTVPTGAQRLEAAVVARAIPGVHAVRDDLRLVTATP
jgi:osmotically-inducible protein OsmY